jgi:hypothetical protein
MADLESESPPVCLLILNISLTGPTEPPATS